MARVEQVEVVLANNDRVTLRVSDEFLKIDTDQARTDVEVEAMATVPVPTPEILCNSGSPGRRRSARGSNAHRSFGTITWGRQTRPSRSGPCGRGEAGGP